MSITKRFVAITLGVATVAGVGGAAFAVGRSITADVPEVITNDTTFEATLTGSQEVPPADPDGLGSVNVTIDAATDEVCITGSIVDTEDLLMMHIHQGIAGVNGGIVVDFMFTGSPATIDTCVPGGAITDQIIANPLGFYVNAHTTTYPAGAVRGQLEPQHLETSILPTPVRAYDSRQPNTLFVPAHAPNTTTTVDLSPLPSPAFTPLPPTAVAALVTITVTETTGLGFLTAYPASLSSVPATSTVNWTAPQSDVAATTTVKLSPSGEIKFTLGPNGGADVIIDVIGFLSISA
jgi:CHRD domain